MIEGTRQSNRKLILAEPHPDLDEIFQFSNLAKIFETKKDESSEELNLNTVLLLNPKNEEAIYMLINLKIIQSNFSEAEQLLKRLKLVCTSFCSKDKEIEKKLESLSPSG